MAFIALFVATAPDADPERHRCLVDTGMYELHVVVARDHGQVLDVCRKAVAEDGVQSIVLCPGHSNEDVGEIARAVGEGVSVSVARSDPPGGRVAAAAMREAGWFAGGPRG